MSKLHESMKDILQDVEKFLQESLQNVSLPAAVLIERNGILEKIASLLSDYPQFQRNKQGHPTAEPSSPPPYLDMKGASNKKPASTEYVYEEYEVCETEPSLNADVPVDNYSLPEAEESPYDTADRVNVPIAASELGNATKSGYLDKKGRSLFNPYQKRWCAVRDGILYYFARPTDKSQCGQITLSGYEARPMVSLSREGSRKDLCFELICPGKKSYQFAATSTKDMQNWVAILEKATVVRQESVSTIVETSTPKSDSQQIHEESIYEFIDDHPQQNTSVDQALNKIAFYEPNDDGQDLYDDSLLPAVLEAQNLMTEIEVENPEVWYLGQWDCPASEPNELSFKRGDLIKIISMAYDTHHWWTGELNGLSGLVPKNYLMPAYEILEELRV